MHDEAEQIFPVDANTREYSIPFTLIYSSAMAINCALLLGWPSPKIITLYSFLTQPELSLLKPLSLDSELPWLDLLPALPILVELLSAKALTAAPALTFCSLIVFICC